jgi:hypothetical protein
LGVSGGRRGEVRFCLSSAVGAGGAAIAVIDVAGECGAVGRVFAACGVARLPAVGEAGVRDVGGVDRALVVRAGEAHVQVHAHGGRYVLGRVREVLAAAGAVEAPVGYPECAGDGFEACLNRAMSRCASPAGVDLLLEQRERWGGAGGGFDPAGSAARERARVLGRLLEPAVVAAVGRANAGKSTLTNALARRAVSVVAGEPGTTRDHVGVLIDVGGVVVRWVDTPGVLGWMERGEPAPGDAGSIDAAAVSAAREVIAGAAAVVHCGAGEGGLLGEGVLRRVLGVRPGTPVVRCGTKADRWGEGAVGGGSFDVVTSAATGAGLGELAEAVSEAVVPGSVRSDAAPWVFDEGLIAWFAAGGIGGG